MSKIKTKTCKLCYQIMAHTAKKCPKCGIPVLVPHPETCPHCGSIHSVTYERFTLSIGEYCCDDCGWGMDAITGGTTYEGEPLRFVDYIRKFLLIIVFKLSETKVKVCKDKRKGSK